MEIERMHGRSRKLSIAILHVTLVASMTVVAFTATPAQADPAAATSLPRLTGSEAEPNGTSATATPLTGTDRVRGNINPVGDVDFYSFTATAGTRVYSAVMTSGSQSGNNDSILALIGQDGTTVIEDDDNNGVFGSSASSIAGTTIPSNGTYYLRVTTAAQQLRPYDLYLQTRSGSPAAETEPNEAASPQSMPPSNWVSGSTSAASDVDAYNISLNAGDTVYVSLDMDPERNGEWNGRLNFGTFSGTLLTTNDAGSTGYDSEAFFTTVKSSGTYRVQVEAITTFGTYNLSTTVIS
ncbi:MAG TPA: PPC domain-containing protein, partial [Actinomycetota bacterium]|nr:PPC domain-containing protein [Actinomycetota bacterium]